MLWAAAIVALVAVFLDFVLPRLRPPKRLLARIDEVSARFAAGQDPTEAELMECGLAVLRLYRVLSYMNFTGDNRRFSALHRATFYLAANQVAAMRHPEHNAWPVHSELRRLVLPTLQTIETAQESFRHLALITPALLAGNGELAERSYRQLPPTLARVALHWMRVVRAQGHGNPEGALAETVLQRVEAVSEHQAPPLSAEQHWALSASRYTWDEFGEPRLAALAPPAACRMSLASFWEIHDSKSAMNMLGWLSEEGHRGRLGAELRPEVLDQLPVSKQRFLQQNVDQLRKHMILAWDAVRLIETAREAVKAGYLDEPTAWEFILPAAAALRAEYGSWRELSEDFMLGWRYWDEQHRLEPWTRAEMEWLTSPGGPWANLGWELVAPRAMA